MEGEEDHSGRKQTRIVESGLHVQLWLNRLTTSLVCHHPHCCCCHYDHHYQHCHCAYDCQELLDEMMNYYCVMWKASGYFKQTSRIILSYMDLCVVTCIINSIKDTDLAECDTYRTSQSARG